MNVTEAATLLLTNFAPEERSIPDNVNYPGRNASVLAALNGALQELYGNGGPWLRQKDRGYLVYAPTAVTVSVTQGSRNATVSSGWAAWMAGCTIVINGSTFDNRITNDSSSVVLMAPHDGATGSTSATVYHDGVSIEDDVMEIVQPVRFERQHLVPLADASLNPMGRHDEDYGAHRERLSYQTESRAANAKGKPTSFTVTTWDKGDAFEPRIRVMLSPFPDRAGMLDLKVKLRPPVISSTGSTDDLPIPHEFTESIFLPVAMQRLTGSAFYRSDPTKEAEVGRAYTEAMKLVRNLNPRRNAGRLLKSAL